MREQFYESLEGAVRSNPEIGQFQGKATLDITPSDALDIFTKCPDEDLPLLWLNAEMSRPERMVLTHLPVPPVCIRPSVKMDGGASNEDDLTCKLASIIDTSNAIREHMAKGQAYDSLLTTWDSLNLEVAQCVIVVAAVVSGVIRCSQFVAVTTTTTKNNNNNNDNNNATTTPTITNNNHHHSASTTAKTTSLSPLMCLLVVVPHRTHAP